MSDQRNKLQALFSPEHRYQNFGEVMVYLNVKGFRCHSSTTVEVESPITAFCGFNGTGKSTLLQLAAVGYKAPIGERYHVQDFIVRGTLDPAPFSTDAAVEYGYWQENRSIRKITITRSDPEKRWRGYTRQPVRPVYFAGMGLYLPKVELRDFFVVRHASKISVVSTEPIADASRQRVAQILGYGYESIEANTVQHAGRTSQVVTVVRGGSGYSEANMGCGEGRVQHIIRALETLPEKSLVLLEEPETSLHPSAQHEFGLYLIDVCIKRRHQVILTTHSEYLLTALPSSSRIYIDRGPSGLKLINGITTGQATSLMTGGHDKALHVIVEDDVAEAVLVEILRRADAAFLRTVKVCLGGDTKAIQSIMTALKSTGLPVAAVRDGDKGASPADNLFKLPGDFPPEKAILSSAAVGEFLRSQYGVNLDDFLAAMHNTDHHEWLSKLAENVTVTRAGITLDLARVYVAHLPQNDVDTLTALLKESIRR